MQRRITLLAVIIIDECNNVQLVLVIDCQHIYCLHSVVQLCVHEFIKKYKKQTDGSHPQYRPTPQKCWDESHTAVFSNFHPSLEYSVTSLKKNEMKDVIFPATNMMYSMKSLLKIIEHTRFFPYIRKHCIPDTSLNNLICAGTKSPNSAVMYMICINSFVLNIWTCYYYLYLSIHHNVTIYI